MTSQCRFAPLVQAGAACRLAVRLWMVLGLTACGTGISLDPTPGPGEGARSDGDANATDADVDVVLADASDELDVSVPNADADGAETPSDVVEVSERDAELMSDATMDVDAGGGDTGDVALDSADPSDGAADDVRDGAADADAPDTGDGCTVACGWPEADYYVDASAAANGDGSKLRPFKTITAAIAAYQQALGQSKKVYAAAGTYDQALGERFPLVLRGLSLEGAGRDRTLIVGTGTLIHSGDGGPMRDQYLVTVLAGDRTLETIISGVSIRSESPVPTPNYYGVFCDRGSATGDVAAPGGQTKLEKVDVGAGYQASVLATISTSPSLTGCDVVVRSSLLTGGWAGLRAVGCDLGRFSGSVKVELGGPDPSNGNIVSWMQAPGDVAAGVRLEGCVDRGVFQNNSFVDSTYGIYIDDRGPWTPGKHTFLFTHNSFERLTAGGIHVFGDWYGIDEISDNRFTGVSRAVTQDPGARAVAVSTDLLRLGKVRRNQFIGNDFGMLLSVPEGAGQPADLGTVVDPGGNVFRCNSALKDTGADLAFVGVSANAAANWGGTVHLAGNAWDHAPATVRSDDPVPNGTDVSTVRVPNVVLDVQNASVATNACPVDRVPGQ